MKVIKKVKAKYGDGMVYQVQEQTTGVVYEAFLTREAAQIYIDNDKKNGTPRCS
jgi:hypothetical protein